MDAPFYLSTLQDLPQWLLLDVYLMSHDSGHVTEEYLDHCCIVTVAALLGINLIRDTVLFTSLFRQPLCKNQLSPVIEVCLKETTCTQFVDKCDTFNVFQENCDPNSPSCKWNPSSGNFRYFGRMQLWETLAVSCYNVVFKIQPAVGWWYAFFKLFPLVLIVLCCNKCAHFLYWHRQVLTSRNTLLEASW